MRFPKRVHNVMLLTVVCLLLISCGGGGSSSSTSIQSIQSPTWQLDGTGFVQFTTNDSRYYQYNFWSTFTYEALMSTVTATVKKQSGSASSGYGIIFCYQDNSNFYRLMITVGGYYAVTKRVGGTTTPIIDWIPSGLLHPGFGVENGVSVVQTSPFNFTVYFNGTQATTFFDPNFSGGRAGFYAYVSDQTRENFPDVPVDIRFKMSSPIIAP
jgi:hypothetical protein